MMKKIYFYNDKEYEVLPAWLWPNVSPVTENFFIAQGGRIEEQEDPPIPEIKHYSKLQILLYIKQDLHLLALMKSIDKIFLKALEELDYFIYWDAAEYISTDYENYDSIIEAVKERLWNLIINEYIDIWRAQGYTEKAIEDMIPAKKQYFDNGWTQALKDIEKYGEA